MLKRSNRQVNPSKKQGHAAGVGRFGVMALEPRFMFDAAGMATATETLNDPPPPDGSTHDATAADSRAVVNAHGAEEANPQPKETTSAPNLATEPPAVKNVVFVDTSVNDYQTLIADIAPGASVVLLDPNREAFGQMADALSGMSNLDSIQVVSHGNQGHLYIAGRAYWADGLTNRSQDLQAIGAALRPGGDILFYACNVGGGEAGQEFVQTLHRLTGADVAVSNDQTGSAEGQNWTLETQSGAIEAATPFARSSMDAFAGRLGSVVVTSATGTASGSLNHAIANAGAGDVIEFDRTLTSSKISLGVTTTGLTAAAQNFTINGDVNGDGVADITISGDEGDEATSSADYRGIIFNASSKTLTVKNLVFERFYGANAVQGVLTLQNGSLEVDGVIFKNNLNNVIATLNTAASLSIKNSIFSDNKGEVTGTAGFAVVRSMVTGTLTIENSVFSDNNYISNAGPSSSTYPGSTIMQQHTTAAFTVNIRNTTIANNRYVNNDAGASSIKTAGIGIYYAGPTGTATVNVYNTIIAGNSGKLGSVDFADPNAIIYNSGKVTLNTLNNYQGAITGNAIFVDSTNADISLRDYRPHVDADDFINAGDSSNADYYGGSYDIRGIDRIRDGALDLGAYEVHWNAGTPTVDLNGAGAGNDEAVSSGTPSSGVLIAPNAVLAQTDTDTRFLGATITLAGVIDTGKETLTLSTAAVNTAKTYGIAVLANDGATITLNGAASVANYQAVIRLIQYKNAAASFTAGVRTATITTHDGETTSTARTSSITLAVVPDTTPPTVSSIAVSGAPTAGASSIDFTVTFSESVTGVDLADFTLATTGTASGAIASVSGSGNVYTISVNTISGVGTLGLNLKSTGAGIQDEAATPNSLADGGFTGDTHTVDRVGPVFTSSATPTAAENQTAVVTLAATDDTGPVAYSIVGGADQAKFSLTGAALSFAAAPDFENPTDAGDTAGNNTYVVTVRATDAAGNITDQTLTVTVTNENEAPTLTAITTLAGATEDTAFAVTYAALLAAADEADPDAGDTLVFRVEAVSTGTLYTDVGLTTQVVAGTTTLGTGQTWYWKPAADANGSGLNAFTVKAVDSASLASATAIQVTVDVAAVNDAPVFTSSDEASVSTYDANGVTVKSVTTTDAENHTRTYSIVSVNGDATTGDVAGDGVDFDLFAINSSTGVLTAVNVSVLTAGTDAYSIVVRADDGAGGTTDQTIKVSVTDTLIVTTNSDSGDDAETDGTYGEAISDGGGLSLREALALAASGGKTIGFAASLDGQTITLGSDADVAAGTTFLLSNSSLTIAMQKLNLAGGFSVNAGSGYTLTINSTVGDAGSGVTSTLTKSGAGTLVLGGTNNTADTGLSGVTVSAGTLQVAGDANLSFGGLNDASSVTLQSGGTLKVTGATTIDNAVTLTGAATIDAGAATTISGAVTGAFALTKAGAGTLTLSNTGNGYGAVTVSAGGFSVASDNNLGSGAVTLAAGTTLYVTGATAIDNAVTLTGAATIDASAATTISGAVTGAFALTKAGAGTLTLSNTGNGYGAVTVSAGGFSVASDNNLGSGAVTLAAGTTLYVTGATAIDNAVTLTGAATIDASAATTISGAVTGAFALTKAGTGTLTLSNTGNGYGAVTVSAGGLSVASDNNLGSGAVTLAAGTTLYVTGATAIDNAVTLTGAATIDASAAVTLSGVLSGTGSLTKNGAATLTLSGTNTYAGATTISAGALSVTGALSATSSVSVASGATLAGTGSIFAASSTNTLTVDAGGYLAPGTVGTAGQLTVNGNLALNGTMKLDLAGATAGTGYDQVVVNGTVTLGAASAFDATYTASSGNNTFIVIDNNLADAVSGTLNGVAEGASLTSNSRQYKTSYIGGSGNDVTLQDNSPPVFTVSAATSANEDSGYAYVATASDADGDTVTVTATTLPSWLTFSNGVLSGTPSQADVGTHSVVLTASDGKGGVTTQSFAITVASVNDAPVITSTPPASVNEKSTYSYTPTATDEEGETIAWAATALPSWLKFENGVLTGTPGQADVGSHTVTLTATDASGAKTTQTFTVTVADVNDAPVFTSTPPTSVNEKSVYSYTPAATDAEGQALTFAATTLPSWLKFENGVLSGTPGQADVGSHTVTVTATDAGGAKTAQTFTVTVADVNDAPVFTSTPPTSVNEKSVYSYTPAATDAEGQALTFAATALPSWLKFENGVLSGTPGQADVGSHTVTLTATDASGAKTTQTFTVTVADVNEAPVFASGQPGNATAGQAFSFGLSASDPDGGRISFSATGLPAWLSLTDNGNGTASLSGAPGSGDVGPVSVTVVVKDVDGAATTKTLSFNVQSSGAATLNITQTTITATTATVATGAVTATTSASLTSATSSSSSTIAGGTGTNAGTGSTTVALVTGGSTAGGSSSGPGGTEVGRDSPATVRVGNVDGNSSSATGIQQTQGLTSTVTSGDASASADGSTLVRNAARGDSAATSSFYGSGTILSLSSLNGGSSNGGSTGFGAGASSSFGAGANSSSGAGFGASAGGLGGGLTAGAVSAGGGAAGGGAVGGAVGGTSGAGQSGSGAGQPGQGGVQSRSGGDGANQQGQGAQRNATTGSPTPSGQSGQGGAGQGASQLRPQNAAPQSPAQQNTAPLAPTPQSGQSGQGDGAPSSGEGQAPAPSPGPQTGLDNGMRGLLRAQWAADGQRGAPAPLPGRGVSEQLAFGHSAFERQAARLSAAAAALSDAA